MTIIVSQGHAGALQLPDESVHCVVTSPPYNCGINYSDYVDRKEWHSYWYDIVAPAASEITRILVPGGRAWVNVPVNGPPDGKGRRMNVAHMWEGELAHAGLFYRDTIVWKQDAHDGGTQWGSWLRPSAPNLRGEFEVILCFFKGTWTRERPAEVPAGYTSPRHQLGGDWTDLCRNVWTLPSIRSKFSPAPFPIELPARAIRLSTWPGEVVLDPFGGSGTTAEAADILDRVGISIDVSATQTRITKDRLTTLFGG